MVSGRLTELRGNAGMLAPDGQCKTFDAAANGYVRGEGCGIVVLKRLSEAEADGDRIWGVIAGSAVNQDGATPGLTVPSGEAQERVVEDALARAGVQARTWTTWRRTGRERRWATRSRRRPSGRPTAGVAIPENPLLIGSVKTNIGHLEAAAGVAGLMKATLAVERGLIPRHLNFRDPNPAIDWEQAAPAGDDGDDALAGHRPAPAGGRERIRVVGYERTHSRAGARRPRRRRRGAFLDVRARRTPSPFPCRSRRRTSPVEARATRLLPLSGKSDEARAETWRGATSSGSMSAPGSWRTARTRPTQILSDMAWTAGVGRSHFGAPRGGRLPRRRIAA